MTATPKDMLGVAAMIESVCINAVFAIELIVGPNATSSGFISTIMSIACLGTFCGMSVFAGYGLVLIMLSIMTRHDIRMDTDKSLGLGLILSIVAFALIWALVRLR